jgi:hypothetical protein
MIALSCKKEPSIAEHCTREILPVHGRAYERATDPGKAVVLRALRNDLRKEAARQQWYDFTVDEDGHRRVIKGPDGRPKLLIPEVMVG